jgi:hypothetical protein
LDMRDYSATQVTRGPPLEGFLSTRTVGQAPPLLRKPQTLRKHVWCAGINRGVRVVAASEAERTADLENRPALLSKESFAEAGGVGHLHGRRQVVVEWAEVTPHPARDG